MSIILTCNAGSTNTKLAAFDSKSLEPMGHMVTHNAAQAAEWICSIGQQSIAGIGHRVVHGGREFTQPVLVNDSILEKLQALIPLAPLHQPGALHLIDETRRLYPKVPQIACFDTAFHHTAPDMERRLPLPNWYYKQGIQRYGFHGLSYQYIAEMLPKQLGSKANGKVVVAHLGGGSSACALNDLKSVATTMGFSTLDGLMMGTRCGALDPGVMIHLLKELDMKIDEVERLLYLESGLLGVSGISHDMRQLLASDKPDAAQAVELYCYLGARQIAGLLPALKGLDVLVFTGGIGEHNAGIRKRITEYLRFAGDFDVCVIPTDEEHVIARSCKQVMEKQAHAA